MVQLIPLDRNRVENFAKAHAVPNVEGFVAALDASHGWEFVRRPVDVIDLATFWIELGRLGPLTQLIEFNVVNNLRASAQTKKVRFRRKAEKVLSTWLQLPSLSKI